MTSHSLDHQLILRNVKTIDGELIEHIIPSPQSSTFDAHGSLTLLPALIDSDAHIGQEEWLKGAKEILSGGVTTVLSVTDANSSEIDQQLTKANLPLHYRFFLKSPEEIRKSKNHLAGLIVNIDQENAETSKRLFQFAAQENLIVKVQAQTSDFAATKQAIDLAVEYNTEIFLTPSTQKEIDLIAKAKSHGMLIHAEATLDGLFHGPEQEALWLAIRQDIIDLIGSGGSPEKIKIMLPLLLNAYYEKKISLEKIIHLTRINVERIFRLPLQTDVVLVHLEKAKSSDRPLMGWPVHTILNGEILNV